MHRLDLLQALKQDPKSLIDLLWDTPIEGFPEWDAMYCHEQAEIPIAEQVLAMFNYFTLDPFAIKRYGVLTRRERQALHLAILLHNVPDNGLNKSFKERAHNTMQNTFGFQPETRIIPRVTYLVDNQGAFEHIALHGQRMYNIAEMAQQAYLTFDTYACKAIVLLHLLSRAKMFANPEYDRNRIFLPCQYNSGSRDKLSKVVDSVALHVGKSVAFILKQKPWKKSRIYRTKYQRLYKSEVNV